jgi:tape measure domain-containing protein
MAETNEFYIKIGADVDDAMNKLSRLSSQLSRLASNTQRSSSQISGSMEGASKAISSAFSSMGVALTTAGITATIIGIGKSALTTAAELEQISISFRVFTGSVDIADKMLAQLKEQALKSPMQFQDIVKGAQTLLQYGLTAQQITPITKNLGDISGGNADKFQRLSLAFGQVNAAGRLMGQEARQMINAGFNPLQAISDKTGVSMAVLTQRMHDGQISVRDVAEAFDAATSYGGRFYGMADAQSKSLAGAFNKMSESISFTLAKIGQDLDKTFDFKGIYEHVATLTSRISKNFESIGNQVNGDKFWGNLLKDLMSGLAITIDLCIKSFKGLGRAFEDFNKLLENDKSKNWLRDLDLGIAELFGTKAKNYVKEFHDYLDSFGKKSDKENIIERQMKNTGMRRITDKSYLASFSDDPSKSKTKTKKSEKAEVIVGTDYQTKEYGTHLKKLMQMSADAVAEINNIGLSGSKKKLADLTDAFNKEKLEFQRYGIDTANITRLYLLKATQLQGEIETERKGALMSILDKSINTGWLKNLNEYLKSDLGKFNDTINEFVVNTNAKKIATYGDSMTSALNDFGVNIFTGFANIAGSALAGISTFGDAIAQVGSMFLSLIGDLLIQMGTSAIKLGLSAETIQAVLESIGLPGGGLAAIAAGTLAVAAGSLLKGMATKTDSAISAKSNGNSVDVKNGNVASKASGASYSYGGASYSTQTMRLAIDLTGSITATQSGYQINKSLETTLRVTGR